jgi:hypothetical protein
MMPQIGINMTFLRLLSCAGASVSLLLALAACGGGGEDAPPPQPSSPTTLQPTLVSIQDNVFTPSCAKSSCHTGPTPQAGLRLDAGFSWGNLVNVASSQNMLLTRLVPGDPGGSLLIHKLEGTATVGGPMPADGPPFLQQATIDVISQWIQEGATN